MSPGVVNASVPVPQKADCIASQDYEEIMPLTNVMILRNTPIFIGRDSPLTNGMAIAGTWFWVSDHSPTRVQIGPGRWVTRQDTTF